MAADAGAVIARVLPLLREHARPFGFGRWSPMATDGTLG